MLQKAQSLELSDGSYRWDFPILIFSSLIFFFHMSESYLFELWASTDFLPWQIALESSSFRLLISGRLTLLLNRCLFICQRHLHSEIPMWRYRTCCTVEKAALPLFEWVLAKGPTLLSLWCPSELTEIFEPLSTGVACWQKLSDPEVFFKPLVLWPTSRKSKCSMITDTSVMI